MSWYLIQTKSRAESHAAWGLEDQGYTVYLPTLDKQPLFPGYLFLAAENQALTPITNTRGVLTIVKFGCMLATVPQDIITELQSREFSRPDPYAKGKAVRITSGPFKWYTAIILAKKHDRIRILVNIMRTPQEIEINVRDIEAA